MADSNSSNVEMDSETSLLENARDDYAVAREYESQTAHDLPESSGRNERISPDWLLHELFFETVQRHSNSVALKCGGRSATYAELAAQARRIAAALIALELSTGACVAIASRDPLLMTAGMFGILAAGGAYVPLDLTYPAERLAGMLEDADAQFLLVDRQENEKYIGSLSVNFDRPAWKTLYFDDVLVEQAQVQLPSVQPDQLAYVIFTSGSTGRPKGVMIEHRMAMTTIRDINRRFEVKESDRVLAVSSFSFDLSVYDIFGLLAAGGTVVFPEPDLARDPSQWMKLVEREQITIWNSVPALFEMLTTWAETDVVNSRKSLHTLRVALLSGDWIPVSLPDRWREINNLTNLNSLGGATEGSIWSIIYPIKRVDRSWPSIPYGRALGDQQMYVLNDQLQQCKGNEQGEIYIGGAGVARGYINRPELTAERFLPDPFVETDSLKNSSGDAQIGAGRIYRTGDLGRYLPDGNIEFLGRADFQVKIQGFRIELGEVESVLRCCANVREVVACARRDRGSHPYLVAYYQSETSGGVNRDQLRDWAVANLPHYMVPLFYIAIDQWPLSNNGKVDRAKLPSPHIEADKANQSNKPADSAESVEDLVAQIWASVLGMETRVMNASFTELGGDSLRAVELVLKISRATGTILPPTWPLARDATLGRLLEEIEAQKKSPLAVQPMSRERLPEIVSRNNKDTTFPLSFPQRQMWLADQLAGTSPCYNIPFALRVKGTIDHAVFADALNEIIARHEILRTTFETDLQGDVLQRIHPALKIGIPFHDSASLESGEAEGRMLTELRADARERFDLARGPLVRAALYRLPNGEQVVYLNIHHIVCDGWTLGLLGRELSQVYADLLAGRTGKRTAPPFQYADYSLWQRNCAKFDTDENLANVWKEILADFTEPLNLPTDYSRQDLVQYEGRTYYFNLPTELSAHLQVLAKELGTTLFNLLNVAWQILLGRTSGQNDFCVGTPASGRARNGLSDVYGYFIHVIVLRAKLDPNATFVELLDLASQRNYLALANQDYPFELIIRQASQKQAFGQYPLFPALMVLEEDPANYWQFPDATVEAMRFDNQTAKFEMLLALMTTSQGIRGAWEYRSDLFSASRIKRMCEQWQSLLTSIVANRSARISDLEWWSETDRRILDTQPLHISPTESKAQTIIELFLAQAAKTPDIAAVTFGDQSLSYGELLYRARLLAETLKLHGVRPDTLVGICIERSIDMAVAVLGVVIAGGAYVPLDPALPWERIKLICDDAQLKIVISDGSRNFSENGSIVHVVDIKQIEVAQHSSARSSDIFTPSHLDCPTRCDDLAYVLYTSGSTGKPKGVCMTHRALVNLITWQRGTSTVGESEKTLQFASLGFDVSFQELFGTWCTGGTLVLVQDDVRKDLSSLLKMIIAEKVQRLFLPFVALQHLAEVAVSSNQYPVALKEIITAGEQLKSTAAIRQLFTALKSCRLWNHYGPTECHVVTAFELPRDPAIWPALPPVGRPISNTVVEVRDAWGGLCPIGVPGEIYLGGECVARGYLNRDELTSERFSSVPQNRTANSDERRGCGLPSSNASDSSASSREGDHLVRFYKTGDYGFWNEAGELEFVGRRDDQFKIRGHRVELGEVESAIRSLPCVRDVAVMARNDSGERAYLAAFVVKHENDSLLSPEFVRIELERILPSYMIPPVIRFLPKLPLTNNGKADRTALSLPIYYQPERQARTVPRSAAEIRMLRVWRKVFRISNISSNDHFFELGGDSLLAARLFVQIENEFGQSFSLSELLNRPTPRRLTELVVDSSNITVWKSLVPIQQSGDELPLFMFPGIGGNLVDFYPLTQLLGNRRPIFGLQPQGLDSSEEPLADVARIAANYWEQIREVQSTGPYHLIGYSFGGVLAYELARRIVADDEKVSLLVMIDSSFDESDEKPTLQRILFHLKYLFTGGSVEKFGYLWKRTKNFLRRFQYGFKERPLEYKLDCMQLTPVSRNVAAAHWEAWLKYKPEPFAGHVNVFLAESSQYSNPAEEMNWPWAHLAEQGATVVSVPGTHDMLFKGKNLRYLAERLRSLLEESASNAKSPPASSTIATPDKF